MKSHGSNFFYHPDLHTKIFLFQNLFLDIINLHFLDYKI